MIRALITSQTRIKLLKKFFLNSNTAAHLRGLEAEFGESSNAIRVELNRFEGAGLLRSRTEGNRKLYSANRKHPLFRDIHNIVLKETGIDRVIENVILRTGNLKSVWLTGDFARGCDSGVIELIVVGEKVNTEYLDGKAKKAEELVGRKVLYKLISPEESEEHLSGYKPADLLLLWSKGNEINAGVIAGFV